MANAELLERELIKMARLAEALTEELVRRGHPPVEARLAAEAGIAVFRVGFELYAGSPGGADLAVILQRSLDQLRGLARG